MLVRTLREIIQNLKALTHISGYSVEAETINHCLNNSALFL